MPRPEQMAFEALDAVFPSTPQDQTLTQSAELLRKRKKAEEANQALWAFGGRVRQVQEDWRRLQHQLQHTPKRRRLEELPPVNHSGPLLLLNQRFWEQCLGSSITSIDADNMFGINRFGNCSTICQKLLGGGGGSNKDTQWAHDSSSSCSSNSTGTPTTMLPPAYHDDCEEADSGPAVKQAATPGAAAPPAAPPAAVATATTQHQAQAVSVVQGNPANAALGANGSNGGRIATNLAAPVAVAPPYDLQQIEEVCRQQNLSHLPASRRFSRALKIIRAAQQAQQQQAQQQEAGTATEQPALRLVAVA